MFRRRSVALELRLRAQAEARREAQQKLTMIAVRFFVGLAVVVGVVLLVATDVLAREQRIQEVHEAQLDKLLETRDFVAVFWYARSCRLCDEALDEIEGIDDDAKRFSVDFVKINNKRLAKSKGVKRFPALTFFQKGEMTQFEGDLTDEDEVLDFLTSENMLVIPDKIEDVNADSLSTIIGVEPFVTALFYDATKESAAVISELEKIDDEADVFKIRFVKINDKELADEYSLKTLPALVYFRAGIPVVYHGDLRDEPEVLEWLIQHQTSVDDEDVVEKVGADKLEIMIENVDHLLVLYHDSKKGSQAVLEELENIDDDCDKIGVSFVEVSDARVARAHGVKDLPTLVYYEQEIPTVFAGDMTEEDEVFAWLQARVEGHDIEEVNEEMLERIVAKEEMVLVVFFQRDEANSQALTAALETMDHDLEDRGVLLLKTGDVDAAVGYGIDALPALVMFKRGVPNLFQGDHSRKFEVLNWILEQLSGDHSVEVVTDAMLDGLIENQRHVAVFFYDKKDKRSREALSAVEAIDGRVQTEAQVSLVKIDDVEEAAEYGIERLPALVMFENAVPNVYKGDFSEPERLLDWLTLLAHEDNIEEVNPKLLKKLVKQEMVAAYVYHKDAAQDVKILHQLENIDGELEALDIHLVKVPADAEGVFADQMGIAVTPALVLFKDEKPIVFKGEVGAEHKVAAWIKEMLA